ncbi:hypothetical protein ACQPZJ_12090 [Actinoplanes sp. CA-054009]
MRILMWSDPSATRSATKRAASPGPFTPDEAGWPIFVMNIDPGPLAGRPAERRVGSPG